MSTRVMTLSLVLVGLTACQGFDGPRRDPAVLATPAPPPSKVGRFRVENVSSGPIRGSLLLDSETGETWLLCTGKDKVMSWCKVGPRTQGGSGLTAEEDAILKQLEGKR